MIAALALALALAPIPAPSAGARCGQSVPLLMNLPLGTESEDTDVIDIHTVRSHDTVLGWYYRNRRGDRFVQIARNREDAGRMFTSLGAKSIGASIAANPVEAFIQLDRSEAVAFERGAASTDVLGACFTHALQ